MSPMRKECATRKDLQEEAVRLRATLHPRKDGEGATLITLSGDLGAGKTSFTKAVASAFGVKEQVTSPTFVLEKIYALPEGEDFSQLVHIDAYRLSGGDALSALGFDEIMRDTKNLVLLEWPERIADALPPAEVKIVFEVLSDERRAIHYE